MRIYKAICLFFFLAHFLGNCQDSSTFFKSANDFFEAYVENGKVSYANILEHSEQLDSLLEMAAQMRISENNELEYQAFWINVYNLLVIKGIIENYPLNSVMDVAGFFDEIEYDVGGNQVTLNTIENELLREHFPSEPRFHFVLVCGALGCPPIIDSAFKPSNLEAQLQEQTLLAVNDPHFIRISKNKIEVSQIFDWYKVDFTQNGKSLTDFINEYRKEKIPERSKVFFYPYDWRLNDID